MNAVASTVAPERICTSGGTGGVVGSRLLVNIPSEVGSAQNQRVERVRSPIV
jgi:hypothetical protein